MAKILIPTPLRKFTNNEKEIETTALTVNETVQEVAAKYPEVKQHLFDDSGELRSFLRIYVDNDDINALEKGATKVSANQVVSIIPAIAGGSI